MLKTLTLINTTNNIQFVFDNCNFILTNYVFDNVNMSHTTSKTTKQVGSTVTATNVASRNLIITGTVTGGTKECLEVNKQTLLNITAPFSNVNVQAETNEQIYQITTKCNSIVTWGKNWSSRNKMFVNFTISLLAPNTLWTDIIPTTVSFEGFKDSFTFPFYSTSSHPLIFGYPVAYKPIQLVNHGNTNIGLTFTFTFQDTVQGFSIHNTVTQEQFALKSTQVLNPGDTLVICTSYGEKSVIISNSNTSSSALSSVDLINSSWLELQPGNNEFSLSCSSGNLGQVTGYITYTNEYWGVI